MWAKNHNGEMEKAENGKRVKKEKAMTWSESLADVFRRETIYRRQITKIIKQRNYNNGKLVFTEKGKNIGRSSLTEIYKEINQQMEK